MLDWLLRLSGRPRPILAILGRASADGSERVGDAILATVQLAVKTGGGAGGGAGGEAGGESGRGDPACSGELAFVIDALVPCGHLSSGEDGPSRRTDAGEAEAAVSTSTAATAPTAATIAGDGASKDTHKEARAQYAAELEALLRTLFLDPNGSAASQQAAASEQPAAGTPISVASPLPVGFAFAADAKKLAQWLEGRGSQTADTAARIRAAAVDVQAIAERSGLKSRSGGGGAPSLQATYMHWLCVSMRKDEQLSDWSARPLSDEQLRYAGLDASACLRILEAMESDWAGSAGSSAPPAVPLDALLGAS